MGSFREAMRELGVSGRLIVTDITDTSPAFHKADLGIPVPTVGRIEYIPTLLRIVRKHKIGLLVPLTDLDLRCLSRQVEQFEQAGCTVMVGPEPTITLCRDKARTNALLDEIGLSSIRTLSLSEFRTQPFYPCFVKPVRGSAGVGTAVIRGQKELAAHIATFGELLIVQEYVPGREYTIDVYRSRDGKVRCVVPRQRLVVRSGEVEKGITVKDDRLIEATVRLVERLDGLWGVFCCQCRREKSGNIRFFEINPRFGGGAPLSIAAGANLPLYLLQEVLGLPITAEMCKFADRMLMMRYDEAVFLKLKNSASLPGRDEPVFR